MPRPTKKRVIAYIDGFNLYHAIDDLNVNHLKWVNLWDLCTAFTIPSKEELVGVYYFTAHATWLADAYARHKDYVSALNHFGVTTVLGHFKEKDAGCYTCGARWKSREEKESDVNIAIHLLNDAHLDRYDKAIVVTADSDLVPAIDMTIESVADKEILVATPPNRYKIAREIRATVETRKIRQKHLANNLLPECIVINDNVTIYRPSSYNPPS